MIFQIKIFALALVLTFAFSDKQFLLQQSSDDDNKSLLAVGYAKKKGNITTSCELISDADQIKEILDSPHGMPFRTVSESEMEKRIEECSKIILIRGQQENQDGGLKRQVREGNREDYPTEAPNNHPSDAETTTAGYDGIPVIFPGTKWCGAGDRAKSFDELGIQEDTDRCCRAHDVCNDTLAPGETRNKLTNTSPFTKLSCQCDDDFYDCLDKVNSVTSNTVGNMYFNILKRECYMEDYPIKYPKKCIKYKAILKLTCSEWEKNIEGPKVIQWVPAKRYKKIPIPGPLTVNLPG